MEVMVFFCDIYIYMPIDLPPLNRNVGIVDENTIHMI